MDMQKFGQNLLDLAAERTLSVMRSTSADDIKKLVTGGYGEIRRLAGDPLPGAGSPLLGAAAAFTVGAALGAGIVAIATPVSGTELRQSVVDRVASLRENVMGLGRSLSGEIDRARSALTPGSKKPRARRTRKAASKAQASASKPNGHASKVNGGTRRPHAQA